MKYIPLSQNLYTTIDEKDYENLSRHKWYVLKTKKKYYAVRNIPKGQKQTLVLMHREILNPGFGLEVDHINGDGLDNRRNNIRICTKEQNNFNRKHSSNSSSKFKGVTWNKPLKKWISAIRFHKKRYHLGVFDNEKEAAKVYNENAGKLFGEFAKLNDLANI